MTDLYSSPCSMSESDLFPAVTRPPEISSSNTIFYSARWRECVAFYRDVLGFEVTFEKDGWFMELRVNAHARISIADEKRCTIASAGARGVTLSWCVTALEPLRAYLLARQVPVTEITSGSWRAPWFYAYDPEGRRIEFWCDSAGTTPA